MSTCDSLAAVTLLGFGLLAVFFLLDDSPPDDRDLAIERREIAEDANGYSLVDFEYDEIYWPDGDEGEEVANALAGPEWNQRVVDRVVEKNEVVLERFERSLERPEFQIPALESVFYEAPQLLTWRSLVDVARLRMRSLFRQGKERQAFSAAMQLVRFGQRIQSCGGDTVFWSVGSTIKWDALDSVQELLIETKTADELIRLARALASFRTDRQALKNALEVEYSLTARAVDDMAAGTVNCDETLRVITETDAGPMAPLGWCHRMVFKPNRTKRLLLESVRLAIRGVDRYTGDELHERISKLSDGLAGAGVLLRFPNLTGLWIHWLKASTFEVSSERFRDDVHLEVTRTLLALKACRLRRGHLPPLLDDLVPEFLDDIPVDPYDGKPLRYSRERKIVYSIGDDGEDSGGSEYDDLDEARADELEPTYRMGF